MRISVRNRRLVVASWIFLAASVYGVIAPFADLIPKHALDAGWPAHARFHVTWAAGKLLALALLTALIAWYPFRRGEPWSWFALAIVTVFGLGSLVAGSLWHMSGPPPHLYAIAALSVAAMLAALGYSWRPVFRGGPEAPDDVSG